MSTPFETSETQGERKPGAASEQEQLRVSASPAQIAIEEKAVMAEINQRREQERQRGTKTLDYEGTYRDFHRQLAHYEEGLSLRQDPLPQRVVEQNARVMDRRMDAEKLNLNAADLKTVKDFERAVLSGDLKTLSEFGKSSPKPEVLETIRRDFHQIHMDVDWQAGQTSIRSEWNSTHPMLQVNAMSSDQGHKTGAHLMYRATSRVEFGPGSDFRGGEGGKGVGLHLLSNPTVAAREMALIANARLAELRRR